GRGTVNRRKAAKSVFTRCTNPVTPCLWRGRRGAFVTESFAMNLTLKIWRQKDRNSPGRLVAYPAADIIPDMSFLEMLDVVNETLIAKGEEPIAFDSDCREGICGTCSLVIKGIAHGGQ